MINSKEWSKDDFSSIDEEMESEQKKYYTCREENSVTLQEGIQS